MENKTTKVTFAAIDPYIQDNIVSPAERVLPGRDMVEWGERNAYPDYILGLVNTTPSLRSVILGTTDYITGDVLVTKTGYNLGKSLYIFTLRSNRNFKRESMFPFCEPYIIRCFFIF